MFSMMFSYPIRHMIPGDRCLHRENVERVIFRGGVTMKNNIKRRIMIRSIMLLFAVCLVLISQVPCQARAIRHIEVVVKVYMKYPDSPAKEYLRKTIETSESITIDENDLSPGYKIASISYDNNCHVKRNGVYGCTISSLRENTKVILKLEPIEYTIHFDKNNSPHNFVTGEAADMKLKYDEEAPLPDDAFRSVNGYEFSGWYDKAHSQEYEKGSKVKNLTSKDGDIITLSAKWMSEQRYGPSLPGSIFSGGSTFIWIGAVLLVMLIAIVCVVASKIKAKRSKETNDE